MYTITAAEAPSGEDLWAVFSALRLLDEAARLVASAQTETAILAEDAHWETKGIRRLRRALTELCASLGGECSELHHHQEMVRRVAMS
ncbi:hypothetical protein [Microbacterium suwonense]|uniref:Uncharacterized protein n=1 Tax=Microbacterium suwonense TaxID=683047 RepID=A0ABN6X9F2_9MICO|nr:hypothetical protein [Microbacterium suwonense]BDZ40066.1 hypothetical protein GCM10025863_26800 [Microbacterium suwonense]